MAEQWNFTGPLTKSQALFLDKPKIIAELKQFRPEKCRNCWEHLEVVVIGGLATRVVLNEVSVIDAAKEVVVHTADCTGGEIDQDRSDSPIICPKENQDRLAGQTDCW